MYKYLCSSAAALIATGLLYSDAAYCDDGETSDNKNLYQMIISAYHVRENENFWGDKNTTCFRFQPMWTMGNVVFETDLVIGKTNQSTSPVREQLVNVLKTQAAYNNLVDNAKADEVAGLNEGNSANIRNKKTVDRNLRALLARKTSEDMLFRRNYTRATYENKSKNYKVIFGDAPANVTFGGVQGISGAGVSFVRTSSMFDLKAQSTLNCQSCITILRPSLVEVIQDGCTIQATPFAPGVYSLADFVPEAGLHHIEIKITDDFQHGYTYKVDGNSDKVPLAVDTDEFEVRAFLPHLFNPIDPYSRKYADYVVFSGVYRYGYTKDITLNVAGQAFSKGFKAETGYSYATKFGLFSQAFGASFGNDIKAKNAVSAQFYYKTPTLPIGTITFSAGVTTKGYLNLYSDDEDEIYRQICEACSGGLVDYVSPFGSVPFEASTVKTMSVKFEPCEIIKNIATCFLYKQSWKDKYMKYSYDLSLTWKVENFAFVSGIGITTTNDDREYADGLKVLNSTDFQRRLYLGVDIMIGKQLELCSSYDYDDNKAFYNNIDYKPAAIKGLTISLNSTLYNGCGEYRNHGGKIKYECKYGDIRIDHSIKMRHKPGIHNNRERIYLNTYIKNNEFCGKYKTSYILSTSKDDLRTKKAK